MAMKWTMIIKNKGILIYFVLIKFSHLCKPNIHNSSLSAEAREICSPDFNFNSFLFSILLFTYWSDNQFMTFLVAQYMIRYHYSMHFSTIYL